MQTPRDLISHRLPATRHRPVAPTAKLRRGFTLVEILVVLGIIALLAAILLPVLANARGKARQSVCASSLKQLGLAFMLYEQDFDGQFPNPGGRGMKANGTVSAVSVTGNGAVWCLYALDNSGLFSYLGNSKSVSDDTWTCPSAASQGFLGLGSSTTSQYNIGRTYVMNDYLRAAHPGQAVTAVGDVPGNYNPSFQTGIKLDAIGAGGSTAGQATSASQVILLYEGVENANGTAQRNGSPYFSFTPSRYGANDLPANVPEEYHFGMSNFLFCDGHVKALHPTQTWTSATQDALAKFNSAYAQANGGRQGSGSVDMWNPQTLGVIYP